jgi:hypothetical protein
MWKQGFNYTKEDKFQRYICRRCGFLTSAPVEDKVVQKIDTILKEKEILK